MRSESRRKDWHGWRLGVRGSRPFCPGLSLGTRAQAREGEQEPFVPWNPPVPHSPPGEAGLLRGVGGVAGEAAKIQLSREGVGEMDAPRAEARAEPQIRGRRLEPETFSPGP